MTAKHKNEPGGAAGQTTLRLEAFLPYRLNWLSELVSKALSRIYAEEYKITIPEWRVIATLGQFRSMTARDVGNHSKMNKSKVSRAVATLEERNLVIRQPNPHDMREHFLTLTDEGKDMYANIAPDAIAFNAQLLGALTREEKEQFERLVLKLTVCAGDLEGTGNKAGQEEE
ncbi:MAG: MarR family winged helix-turn-helix transcriptional regulator [Hyphomicrobiales bacterium]